MEVNIVALIGAFFAGILGSIVMRGIKPDCAECKQWHSIGHRFQR